MSKGLVATLYDAFQIVLLNPVNELMFGESMFSDSRIIAMLALQDWLGSNIDFVRGIQMIVKRIFGISSKIASLRGAIVPLRPSMLSTHMILQRHSALKSLPAFAAHV